MPVAAAFTLLPYAQATPAQRQQALRSAQQVLAAAYPHVCRAHWSAAIEQVQPPLLVPTPGGPVLLAHEGLAALGLYLAAPPPPTAAPAGVAPGPADVPRSPAPTSCKQTYAISPDLREQLARISYWRRVPVNQLVVHGLTRLVADYPAEAARPVPLPAALT